MKLYTKTGNDGTTVIIGGRLPKDDCRVEAYGDLDELNSWIGLTLTNFTAQRDADLVRVLTEVQQRLFDCCSDVAAIDPTLREGYIQAKHVESIEHLIDRYTTETPEFTSFILPDGTPSAAMLHLCRTVAHRAERRIVNLICTEPLVNAEVLRYVNRLSDLFFTLARVCNARAGVKEKTLP